MDEPLLIRVRGEDRRHLGEERRLQARGGGARQRPDGPVDDRPLRERKWRTDREDANVARLELEALGQHVAVAQIGRRQDRHLRAVGQQGAGHGGHGQRYQRQRGGRRLRIAHDPLAVLGLEKERQPCQRRVELLALLQEVLLLAGRGRREHDVVGQLGRMHAVERAHDLPPARLQPLDVLGQHRPVFVGQRQTRQGPSEPRAHLVVREAGGEDGDELVLEVVRLVDDQQAAPPQVLGMPVPQRREIGGVRAEDRRVDGRLLGAHVRAPAGRAARPSAQAARGRHRGTRVALAQVIVAALDQGQLAAELALVLVLKMLLRRQQVGVAAPARQRHREMALADAGRRLHEQHARRPRIVGDLGQRVSEPGQQARLLGTRRGARGKVLQQIDGHRGRLTSAGMMNACRLARRAHVWNSPPAASCSTPRAACCSSVRAICATSRYGRCPRAR